MKKNSFIFEEGSKSYVYGPTWPYGGGSVIHLRAALVRPLVSSFGCDWLSLFRMQQFVSYRVPGLVLSHLAPFFVSLGRPNKPGTLSVPSPNITDRPPRPALPDRALGLQPVL